MKKLNITKSDFVTGIDLAPEVLEVYDNILKLQEEFLYYGIKSKFIHIKGKVATLEIRMDSFKRKQYVKYKIDFDFKKISEEEIRKEIVKTEYIFASKKLYEFTESEINDKISYIKKNTTDEVDLFDVIEFMVFEYERNGEEC